MTPKSRPCPYCERIWPFTDDFVLCPCCTEKTGISDTKRPIGDDLARTMRLDFAFGWWLLDRWLTEPSQPT